MRIQATWIRAAVVMAATWMVVGSAWAERYDVFQLGDSPVSYVEHRNSINASAQIAWTELISHGGSTVPRARVTDASDPGGSFIGGPGTTWVDAKTTDLHALLSAAGGTFATDFISRAEDINDSDDVVGYSTNTPLEYRRHAAMWFMQSGGSYEVIDLHAALESHPTLGGSYDMSAAYGVSERIEDYIFIAGYGRRSRNTGSIPLVWRIKVSAATVDAIYDYSVPTDGSMNYGILYDVAARKDGNRIQFAAGGGVGGQNSGGAYMQAVGFLQNVPGGAGTSLAPFPNTSGSVPVATSVVNRVEVYDGEFYGAGSALRTNGSADAFLWIWDNGTSTMRIGGEVSSGEVALGIGLGMREDSAAIPNQPQIVGASTVAAGAVGSGNASSQAALTAFHTYTNVGNDLDRTCDLNAQVPDSSVDAIEVATDIGATGAVVGWQGANAVVAVPIESDVVPRFRRLIYGTSSTVEYWWVELPGVNLNDGYVLFSDEPGCSDYTDLNGTQCDAVLSNLHRKSGFPNSRMTQNAYSNEFGTPLEKLGRSTYHISAGSYSIPYNAYAQVIGRDDNGDCFVSDVVDLSNEFGTNLCEAPTGSAFDLTRFPVQNKVYGDCRADDPGDERTMGCETNISSHAANCGACGNVCNSSCYSGGGVCSEGACSGTPKKDNWERGRDGNCGTNNWWGSNGCASSNDAPSDAVYLKRDGGGAWNEDHFYSDSRRLSHSFYDGGPWEDDFNLTIFPIDDVDRFKFRVDDWTFGGGFHGGNPTGDQPEYWQQPQPYIEVWAPANQSLQVTMEIECKRDGANLIGVNTHVQDTAHGGDELFGPTPPSPLPSPAPSYSYVTTIPAGGHRYIKMQPDCGPGGDDSSGNGTSDPNGYDDGVYVHVAIEHGGGVSECFNNTDGNLYEMYVGNDVH